MLNLMTALNKKIDSYIDKSADFAKPILNHFRNVVHKAHPDIEETVKWGMPFFEYKGPICNMAAFKQHCAIGFWKASLMKDPHKIFSKDPEAAMGQFGKITSLRDLPSDKILIAYIKEAVKLNEEGIKVEKKPIERKELVIPSYFISALKKNKKQKLNLKISATLIKKNILNGSLKQRLKRQEIKESQLQWNGSRKVKEEIGSMKRNNFSI